MADADAIITREYDVFISYAHADEDGDDGLTPASDMAAMLEAEGYSVWIDQRLTAGEEWPATLQVKVLAAKAVLALLSPNAVKSEWVYFETKIAANSGTLVPLQLAAFERPERFKHLSGIHQSKLMPGKSQLNKPLILAALEAKGVRPSETPTATPPPADPARIQLTLPSGASHLFGRDVELTTLANAWGGTGAGKTNVVVFHAIGGAGKSALVRHFVDGLAAKGFPGAAKVYGWSAYSQGSGDNRDTASAEGFMADALGFFGHDLARSPITDPTERGRTLARLVRRQRTLLILDGLEPLQDQPLVNGGRLKDKGLAALITGLADDNPGLLVITSRQELPELANHPLVVNSPLDHLDTRAGAELLKHLGVHGRERDLMNAVAEVGGHSLTVNLLGTYLATVCAGDVTRRDTLRLAEIIEDMAEHDETARKARRAQAVMRAYEARFAELAAGGSKGKGVAEIMLMRLVGLFNRPAEPDAIAAVLVAPPIAGLTEAWHALTPRQQQAQWGFALARLRKLRLLLSAEGSDPAGLTPGSRAAIGAVGSDPQGLTPAAPLDAHPVVRQHFGDALARTAPEAFREANLRLYRHFAALPEKRLPDTLAEMEPLFRAIAHGCAAGRHQEVFYDVYGKRVLRGNDWYIWKQLGAFSANLGALANFFAPPWSTPHPSLTLSDQDMALNFAAFALRGLGRLRDALIPMTAGANLSVKREDWKSAAAEYINLSETRLTLGDVAEAVAAARDAVTHADTSQEASLRMASSTKLADALHQAGDLAEAERLFREAEAMQAKNQPGFDKLYSVRGYQFCDLLFGRGAVGEVRERADYGLRTVMQGSRNLLDIALNTLALGRAAHLAWLAGRAPSSACHPGLYARDPSLSEGDGQRTDVGDAASTIASRTSGEMGPGDPRPSPRAGEPRDDTLSATARRHLDSAVEGLRKSGTEHHIPRGLLARAAFRRDAHLAGAAEGDLAGAQQDLSEAHEIANRGGMRLFLADYYLAWGRLVLAHDATLTQPENRRHADYCWSAAQRYIAATGYHRRDGELAALRAAIDQAGAG